MIRIAALAVAVLPAARASELQASGNLLDVRNEASRSLSDDFEELGCYADNKNNRIFSVAYEKEVPNLKKKYCRELCTEYPYYGLQYGNECWCGDYKSEYDKYGEADNCDIECSGNSEVNCGGYTAMRVFTQVEEDGDSEGCYKDSDSDRVFSNRNVDTSDMSPSLCNTYCLEKGMDYYGTQFGEECWCGSKDDDYTKHGEGTCDIPCSGDPRKFCGGDHALTVYNVDGDMYTPAPETPSPTEASIVTVPPVSPQPVSSRTSVMAMPGCDDTVPLIRYAMSSGVAGRMYLENGGCGNMTALYKARTESDGWIPKGPIWILDDNYDKLLFPTEITGKWLIEAELYVRTGSVFFCVSRERGGDCDELRIQSIDNVYHEIRGHGGSLYFEDTVVTSWDTDNKKVREEYEGGRSFLNCISEYESNETCVGQPKNDYGECRMDIIDSEMGWMGFLDSESYGLTWKVRGFCKNKTNPEVFDTTNVYGDIINSNIHHMYYGMYSYGHQGGVWINNLMHDNHQYGFDPHDDSDYLTIANNTVYNNVNHGIIASKRCNNVEIYGNEVRDGGEDAAGIFLHRSSDSCKVYNNYVHDMQDAGLAILESFDAHIYGNKFENVKYGIRISLGGGNNLVEDNDFINCSKYGLYTYMGSDDPEQTDDGRPGENQFLGNRISDTVQGVKIKEGDNTVITGNTFTGTEVIEFYNATMTTWEDNELPSGVCINEVGTVSYTSEKELPEIEC